MRDLFDSWPWRVMTSVYAGAALAASIFTGSAVWAGVALFWSLATFWSFGGPGVSLPGARRDARVGDFGNVSRLVALEAALAESEGRDAGCSELVLRICDAVGDALRHRDGALADEVEEFFDLYDARPEEAK